MIETPTIDKMNEAIALFMGQPRIHPSDRRWHKDWNCLMPVVEKIELMGHKTIIGGGDHWGNYCNIMFNLQTPDGDTKALGQGKTKIEAVYKAVCDFIHWYNKNKPNGTE